MTDPLVLGLNALVAGLAGVVVWQCYRGYARNGSRPLAFLGLGIALIAFPSFAVFALVSLANAPPYVDVLVVARVCGLLAVLYAFRGA
jgi:hypothetical protein